MKEYLYWACEQVVKDMFVGFDQEVAWDMAMQFVTTHDLSHGRYSVKNYLKEVK